MIHIVSFLLLNKFCFSSNITDYAVLNSTNMSALLEEIGEPDSDIGDPMLMPDEINKYINNNRPKSKTLIVKKRSPADGPFYNLIVNICNTILYKFKSRKISKYFKVLGESLKGLGHGYVKTLVRHVSKQLKLLSEYNGSYLKRKKVRYFLKIILEEKPKRIEFFQSMNALFSIYWDTKMDEYIWLLEDYGRGRRRYIDHETRKLCSDVVFGRLYKRHRKRREAILNKLMLAYREYLADRVRVNYELGELNEYLISDVLHSSRNSHVM